MATAGSIIYTEYNSLKARIASEIERRNATSADTYLSTSSYTAAATSGNVIMVEHIQKIKTDANKINNSNSIPNRYAGDLVTATDANTADAVITAFSAKDLKDKVNNDCSSSCISACVNVCYDICGTSCTKCCGAPAPCVHGCLSTCGWSCGGSCSATCAFKCNNCSGICGPTFNCAGQCWDYCKSGCQYGCSTTCMNGCTGSAGSCQKHVVYDQCICPYNCPICWPNGNPFY